MKILDLKDIVSESFRKELQDSFAYATGMGVVFTDREGSHIGLGSNFCDFCATVNSTYEGSRCCQLSNFHATKVALETKKPYIYICHAGLIDIEIPIIVEGQHVGSIMAGQIRCTDMDKYMHTQSHVKYDWSKDKNLRKLFKKIPQYSSQQITATATALFSLSNYILQKYVSSVMQEDLARKQQLLMESEKKQMELAHQLKIAELDALQKQVNPHFIFNVISSASRLISLEETEKAKELLFLFANMLRYTLNNTRTSVSLQQEIDYIIQYLSIHEIRFKGRISFEIITELENPNISIPFFSLQPLVENCIEHGLSDLNKGGKIIFTCMQKSSVYIISIEDNGKGMSPEKLKELNDDIALNRQHGKQEHIGVYNTYKRLKLFFEDKVTFLIQSKEGEGTKIVITIDTE